MTTTASLNSLSFFGAELGSDQLDQVDGGLLMLVLIPGFVIAAALGIDLVTA